VAAISISAKAAHQHRNSIKGSESGGIMACGAARKRGMA